MTLVLPRDVLSLVLSMLSSEQDSARADCVSRAWLAANADGGWKGFALRSLLLREEHVRGHASWRALAVAVVAFATGCLQGAECAAGASVGRAQGRGGVRAVGSPAAGGGRVSGSDGLLWADHAGTSGGRVAPRAVL